MQAEAAPRTAPQNAQPENDATRSAFDAGGRGRGPDQRNDFRITPHSYVATLRRVQLDPHEAQRIAALVILSMIIVLASIARAYWPEDQTPIPPAQLTPNQTEAERYVLGEPMDLNRATAAELELLPGVGPKLAARIHDAAPFASFDDVDAIKGVGAKMLERLEDEAIIRAPTSREAIPVSRAQK